MRSYQNLRDDGAKRRKTERTPATRHPGRREDISGNRTRRYANARTYECGVWGCLTLCKRTHIRVWGVGCEDAPTSRYRSVVVSLCWKNQTREVCWPYVHMFRHPLICYPLVLSVQIAAPTQIAVPAYRVRLRGLGSSKVKESRTSLHMQGTQQQPGTCCR